METYIRRTVKTTLVLSQDILFYSLLPVLQVIAVLSCDQSKAKVIKLADSGIKPPESVLTLSVAPIATTVAG